MSIDPLTFILEIVNFLVLVWLLHRFLYRPIQQAIAERRQALNQEMEDAGEQKQKALALQEQYQQSLAEWEREKARQQDELRHALNKEQESALAKVRQAAEAERVRLQALSEQEWASQRQQNRAAAAQTALQLTRRLLERLAGSELDQALLRMLLEDLEQLPAADRSGLQTAAQREQGAVTVTTARSLDQKQQQSLQAALAHLLEGEIHCTFQQDPVLLSGTCLVIGDQVLHANLNDELAFFGRSLALEEAH